MVMQFSYSKQKNEKKLKQLIDQRNELTQELSSLTNPASIKADAQANGMIPLNLNTINRINHTQDHDEIII
jgi:hypothetical protein